MALTEKSRELIKKRFLMIKDEYKKDDSPYRNIMAYGDYGTGKTKLATTCPLPVHIDCFDPGGTRTADLQPFIERGDIVVARYENDDWKNPTQYARWYRNFRQLISEGYFDYIGTYFIDSVTTMAVSMMYDIMAKGHKMAKKHPGETPEQSDYLVQQFTIASIAKTMFSLSCHTIMTGHIARVKDEVTQSYETGLLLWGKAADQTPLLFDEKYLTRIMKDGYCLQVHNDGYWKAETRMGGDKFDKFMKQNIRGLLKLANNDRKEGDEGYIRWEDKTPLYEL